MIYVDVETTGLDPRVDTLRVVTIDGRVYDVWVTADAEKVTRELRERSHETFVAHNAQFDLDFIEEHLGVRWEGPVFDTMVAWQMLRNGRRDRASLDVVAWKMLGVEVDKTLQKAGWDGLLLDDALSYASEDTKLLVDLQRKLADALKQAKLDKLFELEMSLLPILVRARRQGILFDVDAARKLMGKLNEEADAIAINLPSGVNPRSPQQVAAYFNLPDSSEETIREMAYSKPLLYKVAEIRKLRKKASTIKKQLIGHVRYDGRIHPSFTQCFTETGRLSSRNPNLQNQDRGDDIRSLFIPSEGHKFVIADYSSLEVRIAALIAKEEKMLSVLREGRDFHSETCAKIFGEETKTTRTLSKNILFGSLFGGGPGTVVRFAAKSNVQISEKQAKEFQDALFDSYPKLKRWHKHQGNTNKPYVYSIQGRRRHVDKGEGYNLRINHIVQASAADGQKAAMILLYKRHGLVPVANVHDELVFQIPSERAEDALSDVESTMVEGMYRALNLDPTDPLVPIEVEGGVANDWSEK